MSHARIRTIFSAVLVDHFKGTGMNISFDNVKERFDDDDENHIETHIIPADTFSDTLSGDHKAFIGIFQMKVVTEYGRGCISNENIVEGIQTAFPVNAIFPDLSGFSVQVTSPIKAQQGKQIGSQWVVPCYFDYRADTN